MTEECPYCKKVGEHECHCFAPAQDILQDDLAKRLRSNYHPEYEGDCLLCEAADRIEQLEAERKNYWLKREPVGLVKELLNDIEWWKQEERSAYDLYDITALTVKELEASKSRLQIEFAKVAMMHGEACERIEQLETELRGMAQTLVDNVADDKAIIASLEAERDRLRMALTCPPILSKYHGKHGFEVVRFISDYSVWTSAARAALDGGK